MIGYKAFDKNLTCRGFQYEIGNTYSINGRPVPCEKGFHFCKSIKDTYRYYPMSNSTRICKIEAIGKVVTQDNIKYCTDKITILEEITDDCELKCNSNSSNIGYCNTGNNNIGNYNSGDKNAGHNNSGCFNVGYYNSGDKNTGNYNSGNFNSGDCNLGYRNSGTYNSGDYNSGNCNSGNFNTGSFNLGDRNSGYFNFGNGNSGIFNTEKRPKIKMFDKESDWTFQDWHKSKARRIMNTCPYTYCNFIGEPYMTEEEKKENPEYKEIGGYVKTFVSSKKDKENWWNELTEEDKAIIKALPNFDFDKFRKCVGF